MRLLVILALIFCSMSCLKGMERWRFAAEAIFPTQEPSCSSSSRERLYKERLLALERQKREENTIVLQEGFTLEQLLCYNKRARSITVLTQENRPLRDNELALIRNYFAYAEHITTTTIKQ